MGGWVGMCMQEVQPCCLQCCAPVASAARSPSTHPSSPRVLSQVQAGESLRACLAATVSADVAGLRRELLPWLQYHTELGAAHFYVRRRRKEGG